MTLLLIRHAPAAARAQGLPDARRPLTDSGRARFRKATRRLAKRGVRFDRLFYSPWLRSVETADLIERRVTGSCEVTGLLARPPTPDLLALLSSGNTVGAVGHEPWLGDLCALLLADGTPRIHLGRGAIAWLEGPVAAGRMDLRTILPMRPGGDRA